jgi:hypothetical protein
MGNLSAIAMTDEELGLSLEQQISWHLTSNHYPPVPTSMVPVCIEAIDAVNEGYGINPVRLPEGVTFKGMTEAPAWDIVEQHHLGAWIIESELD